MQCPTTSPVHVLHAHSVYSTLDGASTVDEYVQYAKSHGLGACGLCDHGYALGLHDLITKCNANGIKPIPGIEFYLMPRPDYVFNGKAYDYGHISLWAMNMEGYRTLINLATLSWQGNRVVKRWGKPKPRISWEDLQLNNAGLLCGSGCIEGPIAKPLLRGEQEEAVKNANILKEVFGDRLYFEVMPHAVVRNYQDDQVISVQDTRGNTLNFMEGDIVDTEQGSMTAKEACARRVNEIYSSNPDRFQDVDITGPIQGTERTLPQLPASISDLFEDESLNIDDMPIRAMHVETQIADDSKPQELDGSQADVRRNREDRSVPDSGQAAPRKRRRSGNGSRTEGSAVTDSR